MVPHNQTFCRGLAGGYTQAQADFANGEQIRFRGTAWRADYSPTPVTGEFYFNYFGGGKVAASSQPAPTWDYTWPLTWNAAPVKKDPHVQLCFRNTTKGAVNVTLAFEVIGKNGRPVQ